jgi:hypothetical protein
MQRNTLPTDSQVSFQNGGFDPCWQCGESPIQRPHPQIPEVGFCEGCWAPFAQPPMTLDDLAAAD